MKVTVCELHDSGTRFDEDWQRLARHVRAERSELVLLPETPFSRWPWDEAVAARQQAEARLRQLAPAVVLGTRPLDSGNERYLGFLWTAAAGTRTVHARSRLTHAWETVWYQHAANADFSPVTVAGITVGFLIGDELSAVQETERCRREGIQLLVSPRSTPVKAGVHELCSTRAGAGPGWILGPAGEVLVRTSPSSPVVSLTLDLSADAGPSPAGPATAGR